MLHPRIATGSPNRECLTLAAAFDFFNKRLGGVVGGARHRRPVSPPKLKEGLSSRGHS